MFRFIYRQRRRLAFATFLIALSVFMLLVGALDAKDLMLDPAGFPWLVTLTVGLVVLIGAVIAFLVFCVWLVIFPNWRFMIEQFALMLFIFQAFEALWPTYDSVPYIGGFLPVVVFFAIFMNAYGMALDRFPVALGMTSRRTFKSSKSPEQLWTELVPLPEHKAAHWDTLLKSIEANSETAQQTVTYNHGASVFQFQRQSFSELTPPYRAIYRFDGDVSDANKPITGGTYQIDIAPQDSEATTVTLTERHDALLPRLALQAWFDDSLGDVTDTLRARERGKRDWSLTDRYRRKVASLS